ncbi:MAG: DUF2510 domain-containing protein [Actinobacteria bacterium]|nr:DUF2510 domain-containing protein [Actinomycetota bacterium]
MASRPDAAWYADPQHPGQLRWWNGNRWSEHTAPGTPPPGYARDSEEVGNGFSVGAIACGAIAFVFFPIILGPIGIVLGAIAKSKDEPRANWGIGVAIAGTVGGMVLAFIVLSNTTT